MISDHPFFSIAIGSVACAQCLKPRAEHASERTAALAAARQKVIDTAKEWRGAPEGSDAYDELLAAISALEKLEAES